MIKNLLYIFILVFGMACNKKIITQHSTYSKGSYSWEWYDSSSPANVDSAWITVKIKDEKKASALMASTVKYGCQQVQTQEKQFSFKVRRLESKHQLKVAALGYMTIETMPFDFSKGDSLVVDFALGEDDRMPINCTGIH